MRVAIIYAMVCFRCDIQTNLYKALSITTTYSSSSLGGASASVISTSSSMSGRRLSTSRIDWSKPLLPLLPRMRQYNHIQMALALGQHCTLLLSHCLLPKIDAKKSENVQSLALFQQLIFSSCLFSFVELSRNGCRNEQTIHLNPWTLQPGWGKYYALFEQLSSWTNLACMNALLFSFP